MFQFRLPVNKNIIISNKKTFWEKLIQMKKAGGSSLQVGAVDGTYVQIISDFDYTLSTFYLEGTERNPSCHGILERCPFFPEDYREKTKKLQVDMIIRVHVQEEYYPIEIDPKSVCVA